ncbi:penicillin acylase family protein [Acidovorax cavernicola]|uniref:Acylase n=1 Tax=Acidovorax cavernicola TaxID=1675792 RepID=A0A9X8D591_9BURK|nr:penicillin acylase family protein [Acidovorax cavernicola]RIX80260.1 hypothetical protein D3H34_13020 [Acidovorax cavernicola]
MTRGGIGALRAGLCAVACIAAGCGGSNGGGGIGWPSPATPAPTPTPTSKYEAQVRWTEYGVPHISAKDYAGLGYGYGYSMGRDHLCLLADRMVTLRGLRAGLFGAEGKALVGFQQLPNLASDVFYRVQLSDEILDGAWRELSANARGLAEGYAAGFNRHLRDMTPEARATACGGVAPPQMTAHDVLRATLQIGLIWSGRKVAAAAADSSWEQIGVSSAPAAQVAPTSQMASNMWAFGADATGSDGALMIANPHTNWDRHWLLMHQMHLTIPGEIDVMGADFLGIPLPLAGYTRDMAWSIKSPAGITFPLLLALDVRATPKPAHVVDGVAHELMEKKVVVDVRQSDGRVVSRTFRVPYSKFGPLYRLPAEPGQPAGRYAVADPNAGNARALDQMLAVAKARNAEEFKAAVAANRGITAHLIAGDRHGQAVYTESGPLLDIDDATLLACAVVKPPEGVVPAALDGSRSACTLRAGDGTLRKAGADSFPMLSTRGIVQSTADSYTNAVFGRQLGGYSLLLGSRLSEPSMRMRMSQRQIAQSMKDGNFSLDEAGDLIFSNRSYVAETLMDGIAFACDSPDGKASVASACAMLEAWDRHYNADSRGALLFNVLWPEIRSIPGLYAQPFEPAEPFRVREVARTPQVSTAVVAAIGKAVRQLDAVGLRGDEPWGAMLARKTDKGRVPLHGGADAQGVLNTVEGTVLTGQGYDDIFYGSSYIQIVRWDKGRPDARVLLAPGQSSDPASPHRNDQLALFARKQLTKPPFTDAEIAADPKLTQRMLRE